MGQGVNGTVMEWPPQQWQHTVQDKVRSFWWCNDDLTIATQHFLSLTP